MIDPCGVDTLDAGRGPAVGVPVLSDLEAWGRLAGCNRRPPVGLVRRIGRASPPPTTATRLPSRLPLDGWRASQACRSSGYDDHPANLNARRTHPPVRASAATVRVLMSKVFGQNFCWVRYRRPAMMMTPGLDSRGVGSGGCRLRHGVRPPRCATARSVRRWTTYAGSPCFGEQVHVYLKGCFDRVSDEGDVFFHRGWPALAVTEPALHPAQVARSRPGWSSPTTPNCSATTVVGDSRALGDAPIASRK